MGGLRKISPCNFWRSKTSPQQTESSFTSESVEISRIWLAGRKPPVELSKSIETSVLFARAFDIKESLPQELQKPWNLIESQMESNSLPHIIAYSTAQLQTSVATRKKDWFQEVIEWVQNLINSKNCQSKEWTAKTLYSKLENMAWANFWTLSQKWMVSDPAGNLPRSSLPKGRVAHFSDFSLSGSLFYFWAVPVGLKSAQVGCKLAWQTSKILERISSFWMIFNSTRFERVWRIISSKFMLQILLIPIQLFCRSGSIHNASFHLRVDWIQSLLPATNSFWEKLS